MRTNRDKQKIEPLRLLTEVQDVVATTDRGHIKGCFVERANKEYDSDYKDLEKTLKINKELIGTLIKTSDKMAGSAKEALAKLNEENCFLLNQIKTLKKQRDDYHGKNFISQQIVEELKAKLYEEQAEHKAKLGELLEALDRKEYSIQLIQHQYSKAEAILKQCATYDYGVALLIEELNIDMNYTGAGGKKITTMIDKTKSLMSELSKAQTKISELEIKLEQESSRAKKSHIVKMEFSFTATSITSSNFKKTQPAQTNDSAGSVQIEALLNANEQLTAKMSELEDKNDKLAKVNACLQLTLDSLSKINILRPGDNEIKNKELSIIGGSEMMTMKGGDYCKEVAEAFNDMSSIMKKVD